MSDTRIICAKGIQDYNDEKFIEAERTSHLIVFHVFQLNSEHHGLQAAGGQVSEPEGSAGQRSMPGWLAASEDQQQAQL